MSNISGISSIYVERLHDQLDVNISFNEGLNIIYGKNGRGKTTILHLIANALELDFARFSNIRFKNITIKTFDGNELQLRRADPGSVPIVFLNGQTTSFNGRNDSMSQAEIASLRSALGGRATYLPAFRSVLERARGDGSGYYRTTERRDTDFDELVEAEFLLLKGSQAQGLKSAFETRQLREEAMVTAQKTLQCRLWFGQFVPVIRYPSVVEVEDTLTEEWRQAHLSVTRREQQMFEETFVKVFKATSGLEQLIEDETNEDLLSSIFDLLKDRDSEPLGGEPNAMYDELRAVARNSGGDSNRKINNSILGLYKNALERRNSERRAEFMKIRDFVASVNEFLDKKKLVVGQRYGGLRSRSAVAIETSVGHNYGMAALSSGERQILTMLFSASRSRVSSGVFLIDEPELSLHIDWQRIILRELKKQSSGRQIIACTHSPEVGANYLLETQDFEPMISQDPQGALFQEEDI